VPEEENIDDYKKDNGQKPYNKILKTDELSFYMVDDNPVEQHQPFAQNTYFLVQLAYLCLCLVAGTYASEEKDDAGKVYLAGK
jgi:hypothetical protein